MNPNPTETQARELVALDQAYTRTITEMRRVEGILENLAGKARRQRRELHAQSLRLAALILPTNLTP